jgi:CheY-like chemotaxis protein
MATVLVIDDEYGIAELLEAVLVDEGHHVLTAANGSLGLDALRKEKPDVIFLDYMMPVMDGAAMLSHMASNPAWRDIPVVMMSSISEVAVAERCKGYVLFLRKPFNIFHVVEVVNNLTGNRPAPAEHASSRNET